MIFIAMSPSDFKFVWRGQWHILCSTKNTTYDSVYTIPKKEEHVWNMNTFYPYQMEPSCQNSRCTHRLFHWSYKTGNRCHHPILLSNFLCNWPRSVHPFIPYTYYRKEDFNRNRKHLWQLLIMTCQIILKQTCLLHSNTLRVHTT